MLEVLGIGLAAGLLVAVWGFARSRRGRPRGRARGDGLVGGGDAFYDGCDGDAGGCDGGGDGGGGGGD